MFAIKVKEDKPGAKAWRFLAGQGNTTRLRVHASRYDSREKADQSRDMLSADNPGLLFKVVTLTKGVKS